MNDDLRTLLERPAEIADDGFTERVVRALPAPRRAPPRAFVVLGFVIAACALSYLLAGGEALARSLATTAPLLLGVMLVMLAGVAAIAAEE